MKKLDIQDHHNTNDDLSQRIHVYADDRDPDAGNASNFYAIHLDTCDADGDYEGSAKVAEIQFQHGPRTGDGAPGINDAALLTVLIDRYRGFQSGDFACRDNAVVITKLEEALMWMQKRANDRARRGVLGKNER